ncbi:MAG: CBS domain-containing protein [Desulfonatronovibrio sp.]
MDVMTVKDLMIPRQDYVILAESSTLYEAIVALDNLDDKVDRKTHSTIIIEDRAGKTVSRLTIFDIMRGIEPKYQEISNLNLNHFGFSNDYLESLFKDSDLWGEPLEELCSKVPHVKIKDIMLDISPSETILIHDSLDKALHKMILNKHRSLMVMKDNGRFAGMIRSIDLFNLIRTQVKKCNPVKS